MIAKTREESRLAWVLGACVLGVALVVYGWVAAEGMGTIGFSDSAEYLFFADFYRGAFFGAAPTPDAIEFYRTTRFPPLFPLLLAAFGGGSDALERAQLVSCFSVLAMLAVLWAWLRLEIRHSPTIATITLVTAISPGLFLLVLNPVSEPLAMGMTWLVFALAAKDDPTRRLLLLLAFVAGLSTLARSINIALVAAIPVWLWLQRASLSRNAAATAVALLPFLAWLGYRRSLPGTESYLHVFDLNYMIDELGGWPELLYLQPLALLRGLAKNFDHDPGGVAYGVATLVLVFAALGWWQRARVRALDAVFLFFYFGVILVWPYPREAPRFLTFILPLLYFYTWLGIMASVHRWSEERSRTRIATTALGALFAIGSVATIWHFVDLATLRLEPELRREMRTQLFFHTPDRNAAARAAEASTRMRFAAREVLNEVPDDDCVYASLPSVIKIHGSIRVLRYPWRFVDGIPIERQLAQCNYFFVAGMEGVVPGHRPFYPSEQLKGWTHPVLLAELGENHLVAALLIRSTPLKDADGSPR